MSDSTAIDCSNSEFKYDPQCVMQDLHPNERWLQFSLYFCGLFTLTIGVVFTVLIRRKIYSKACMSILMVNNAMSLVTIGIAVSDSLYWTSNRKVTFHAYCIFTLTMVECMGLGLISDMLVSNRYMQASLTLLAQSRFIKSVSIFIYGLCVGQAALITSTYIYFVWFLCTHDDYQIKRVLIEGSSTLY